MSQQALQLIAQAKAEGWTRLDLGNCDLHDLDAQIPELFELTQLEVLILSNEWHEWDEARRQWVKKQSPNKGGKNRLAQLPQGIAQLQQLRTLICGGWWEDKKWGIADLSPLSGLVQLTKLYLGGNKITDLSPLAGLVQLSVLYLSRNQLTDLSPLSGLVQLTRLELINNKVADISPLAGLVQLTELYLGYNQLTDISPLAGLVQLTELYLSSNKITDLSPLSGLVQLSLLYLGENQITDLSPLSGLVQLTKLYLSRNRLTDIRPLSGLVQLTELYLNNNQLTDLSPLSGLVQLTKLNLYHNQLTNLSPLSGLVQLTKLNLSNNKITDLSPLLPLLRREAMPLQLVVKDWLETREGEINIQGNPLQVPPMEIAAQGREAVLRYFERKKNGAQEVYLYEAKLVLVGEGNVGKTTLSLKMKDCKAAMPRKHFRTPGIAVSHYTFKHDAKEFTAHIWDFGGQDIYYALHRFFLSRSAVYILMANSRENEHRFDYWLPNIRLFAGRVPILAVCNMYNKFPNTKISLDRYKKDFNIVGNLFQIDLSKVKDPAPLTQLLGELYHQIAQLEHIQKPIWDNWLEVRIRLQGLADKDIYEISYEKFAAISREHDVKEAEIADLGGYLHNLGIVLWYHDNPVLKNIVILKPTWATKALYKLIDDPTISENNGRFSSTDIERLWKNKLFAWRKDELIALSIRFKLCYQEGKSANYIMPCRLADTEPHTSLNWNEQAGIYIVYRYDFLPYGLVNQLTADMHKYIVDAWSKGVVLEYQSPSTRACIKEHAIDRAISVSVSPSGDAKTFMGIIMDRMEDLHEDFKGIEANIILPCPCEPCMASGNNRSEFKYADLIRWYRETGRHRQVSCNESLRVFTVGELLEGIGKNPEPKEKEGKLFRIGEDWSAQAEAAVPRIFISYAGEDLDHLKKLKKQLSPLVRRNAVQEPWHDREMLVGSDWNDEIQNKLNTADVVLLLISADYIGMGKRYIWEKEMPQIIKRHKNKEIVAIPIIVRDCLWEEDKWISQLQAVTAIDKKNNSRLPLCSVPKRKQDEAFKNAAQQIKAAIDRQSQA